ncbi:MAG: hypothetical protein HY906_11335 [Deltaproteobacteria bacterium]|nr:hypothetical protein [Deltaproteobacteria bacterium]
MKTPLTVVAVALVTCLALPAAAQVPSVQDLEEDPAEVFPPPAPLPLLPPPPPPPPAARPAPATVVVPGNSVTVTCVTPPCAAQPAVRIDPAPIAPLQVNPVPLSAQYGIPLDSNWRRIHKLGLGLDIMGPAYTLGVSAHWNISYLFGLSATFGFVGPQVITLQARIMPLDGKWTPYVAAGVSFLLNPGFGKGQTVADCAPDYYGGGCMDVSSDRTGDELLFKGRNIIPNVEVGAMVITHRGFSAQLGVTFYINDKYQAAFDLLTIPWPKIGLAWYF